MLLALAGPASQGAERAALTEVLGCPVADAAAAADDLLSRPHPLVPAAAAVWTMSGAPLGADFGRWQASLPAAVSTGELPDQAGLDAWARQHTLGLIERFPLRWDPALYLVLTTALATKISWAVPFDLAPAELLGPDSRWAGTLSTVLRTPKGRDRHGAPGHMQFIAASRAGQVAVHVATAQRGLAVVSVAAAPDVPALEVLTAAHQIGTAQVTGGNTGMLPLDALPLGAGPAWQIIEQQRPDDDDADCTAVLPAWSANSKHDLSDPTLGFAAAKEALAPGPDPWEAPQVATASYTRTGFEAAAVTALGVRLAMIRPSGLRRVAELRFGHPYAVVAIAKADASDGEAPGWHGLPVFSAWVAEPKEAQPNDG
jgi:hypothetical protein